MRKQCPVNTINFACIHCGQEHIITSDRTVEQLQREAADITCSFCGKPLGKRKAG